MGGLIDDRCEHQKQDDDGLDAEHHVLGGRQPLVTPEVHHAIDGKRHRKTRRDKQR